MPGCAARDEAKQLQRALPDGSLQQIDHTQTA